MHKGVFQAREVQVESPDGATHKVIVVMRKEPHHLEAGRPSPPYKEVILQGALEAGLPEDYIAGIEAVPDNGYKDNIDYLGENF